MFYNCYRIVFQRRSWAENCISYRLNGQNLSINFESLLVSLFMLFLWLRRKMEHLVFSSTKVITRNCLQQKKCYETPSILQLCRRLSSSLLLWPCKGKNHALLYVSRIDLIFGRALQLIFCSLLYLMFVCVLGTARNVFCGQTQKIIDG